MLYRILGFIVRPVMNDIVSTEKILITWAISPLTQQKQNLFH